MKKMIASVAAMAFAMATQPVFAQGAEEFAGPYVGAYVGANVLDSQPADYWCWSACNAPSIKGADVAAGGTIGYNVPVDSSFVVGLEADFGTGANINKRYNDNSSASSWVYDWHAKQKWNATVRARAGLALDRTMVYVTGGLAIADSEMSTLATYGGTPNYSSDYLASWNGTQTGYVIGGGVEHKFGGHISAKVEFLHADYGTQNGCYRYRGSNDFGTCDSTGTTDSVYWDNKVNTLRIGVNYLF